jgi:hypothetical protein
MAQMDEPSLPSCQCHRLLFRCRSMKQSKVNMCRSQRFPSANSPRSRSLHVPVYSWNAYLCVERVAGRWIAGHCHIRHRFNAVPCCEGLQKIAVFG